MKKAVLFLSLTMLMLSGCKFNKVSGSGAMKLDKRSVPAFKSVDISGAYEVEIVAQKEQSVEIEGDDNLLPLIKTEVKNGVLEITAPVAAAALPRRIEIRTTPLSKQIAA